MKTNQKFHQGLDGAKHFLLVFIALIVLQCALAAFQAWNVIETLRPEPAQEIACFEGYKIGMKVGEEIVPLAVAPGDAIDPAVNPMVAIYGTYCTEVFH